MATNNVPEFANVDEFFRYHLRNKATDHLRLGQRFVNLYIKGRWPELFYCVSEYEAKQIILTWLADHQYINAMPKQIGSGQA